MEKEQLLPGIPWKGGMPGSNVVEAETSQKLHPPPKCRSLSQLPKMEFGSNFLELLESRNPAASSLFFGGGHFFPVWIKGRSCRHILVIFCINLISQAARRLHVGALSTLNRY